MNYEQKYKEALNDMRAIYPNLKGDAKLAVEHAFPELRESEDERIRKRIYGLIYHNDALLDKDELLAWLEKQKELFESGRGLYYYDGEKTTYCGYPATEENPYDFAMSQQEKQEEQKVDIDKLRKDIYQSGYNDGYQHGREDEQKEQKPAEWSEEDELKMNALLNYLDPDKGGTKYSSYAQLTEWYNWLKSLRPKPKRVNVSDQTLQLLICYLYGCHDVAKRDWEKADCRRYISYLEDLDYTLKNGWKPREEQMDSLRDTIIQTKGYSYSMYLPELYEQLKNL